MSSAASESPLVVFRVGRMADVAAHTRGLYLSRRSPYVWPWQPLPELLSCTDCHYLCVPTHTLDS